jgi:hypothetical protein
MVSKKSAVERARQTWAIDSEVIKEGNQEALQSLSGPERAGLQVQELGRHPFGPEWAGKVADHLEAKGRLLDIHREYCGLGLVLHEGEFQVVEVHDGGPFGVLMTWPHREAFIDALAGMSEYNFSRHDPAFPALVRSEHFYWANQTITVARMDALMSEAP